MRYFLKLILSLSVASVVCGCAGVHYGYKRLDNVDQATMDAQSERVRNAEREERAERRRERREELMDGADAVRRAHGNRRVYILH